MNARNNQAQLSPGGYAIRMIPPVHAGSRVNCASSDPQLRADGSRLVATLPPGGKGPSRAHLPIADMGVQLYRNVKVKTLRYHLACDFPILLASPMIHSFEAQAQLRLEAGPRRHVRSDD